MAEYALVTTMVAVIALGIGAIPDALLAKRLPTTAAKAQTLVSSSARSQKAAPSATTRTIAKAIRSDRGLLTRLSRMKVSVDQAAEAVLKGSASAC